MNTGKHQSSKQRGQDEGWKVHDRAHVLFFHSYTMRELRNRSVSILVSWMNTHNFLFYYSTVTPFHRIWSRERAKFESPCSEVSRFDRFRTEQIRIELSRATKWPSRGRRTLTY